jgi:hypothetical protein
MLHNFGKFLTTIYFNMRISLFMGLTFLIAATVADDPPLLGPPLALQDVFDVSTDVSLGGCTPDQVTALETAYTESIKMASRIDDASSLIRFGFEPPAVGSMFEALFGIASTQQRQQEDNRELDQEAQFCQTATR